MYVFPVSVLIPVHNAEAYLRQCIDSVLGQTLRGIQIVIVNDGSTDGSTEILRSYAEENPNILLIEQENKGVSAARMRALEAAEGAYIGWVDADDFVAPEMFKTLYGMCKTKGYDFAYCDYAFYPHEVYQKDKWFKPYKGRIDADFIDRNTQHWNKLVSRELLDECDILRLMEEYGEYAYIPVMMKAKSIGFTKEQLYCYRVGIQSLSGGSQFGKVDKFSHAASMALLLHDEVARSGAEQSLVTYFEYRYIYTLIQLAFVACVSNDKPTYDASVKELRRLRYKDNPYTKTVLDANYGPLKAFILRDLVPLAYLPAMVVCKAANFVVDYGRRNSSRRNGSVSRGEDQ